MATGIIQLEHRGSIFEAHVDHGCGPDDTFYRLYYGGQYFGWLQPVGDLAAELFVSSADPRNPRSQADQLDLVVKAAQTGPFRG